MSKVWFITGSSKGFGRHFVQQLIEKGEKVVATARNLETLADLKSNAPDQVHLVTLDVTDKAQVEQAVKEAIATFGRIDVVVNNAGYALYGMLEEASEEQIRKKRHLQVWLDHHACGWRFSVFLLNAGNDDLGILFMRRRIGIKNERHIGY